MMMRTINARQPALTRQEAALLTALPRTSGRGNGHGMNNLLMPGAGEGFIPVTGNRSASMWSVPASGGASPYNAGQRRGSVAGRAVLSAAGISMPGVTGMRRGCRRAQDRQARLYCCEVVQEYELL